MPNLIEDALTAQLAAWLDDHRPEAIPATVPIHVANRDELRTRPCIVLATSEAKPVPGLLRFMGGVFLRALKHPGGASERLLPDHFGALQGLRPGRFRGLKRFLPDQRQDGLRIHRCHLTA